MNESNNQWINQWESTSSLSIIWYIMTSIHFPCVWINFICTATLRHIVPSRTVLRTEFDPLKTHDVSHFLLFLINLLSFLSIAPPNHVSSLDFWHNRIISSTSIPPPTSILSYTFNTPNQCNLPTYLKSSSTRWLHDWSPPFEYILSHIYYLQ